MNEDPVGQMLVAQQETNRWLRILAWPVLGEALSNALQTPEQVRVYRESDGRGLREVGTAAGVSHTTVQNYWRRWAQAGLVEPAGAEGRYRRLVDPGDLGIQVEERQRG